MKQVFAAFFRGFQFRLLAYMLAIGSVTLLLSFIVFYTQSFGLAERGSLRTVRSAHQLMVDRLKHEMESMDTMAQLIAGDPTLRERLTQTAGYPSPDDRIAELTSAQHAGDRYTVCLVTETFESESCQDLFDLMPARPTTDINKQYALTALDPDHWEKNIGIVLHYPVRSAVGSTVSMEINIVYNVTVMFQQFMAAYPSIIRQELIDEQQYGWSPDPRNGERLKEERREPSAYPYLTGDRVVDELPLKPEGYQAEWSSRVEMRSEYALAAGSTLRTTALVLLAVLVALAIGSSVVFSRFFTRPILHLRSLLKRAEVGDLKAYWTSRGAKEIDDLGESYNQMLFRLDELFRQVKLEEALKKEKEIEALQYQLNPHFLYNTLNTIKWVAKIHKTPQISEVVSSLVRLLQASLGKKGDFITIKEEVKLIQDYMEIQAFRYGEQVKLEYDIDPVASMCLVPRMIMQPLVENALIHGLEPKGKDGVITIRAWLERDLLLCQVEDNGVGIPEDEQETDIGTSGAIQGRTVKEKLSGIGLRHIRQKIKLYYGPDYKMHVFSKRQEGTIIRLSLPIHRGEENWGA